jgi:hypothetical protein
MTGASVTAAATTLAATANPPQRRNENQTFVSCEGAVFFLSKVWYLKISSRFHKIGANFGHHVELVKMRGYLGVTARYFLI